MLKDSGKTLDGKKIEYEILANGYDIYLGGQKWITQHDQYSRVIIPDGSYEENALAQIDQITTPAPEPVAKETDADKLRTDIDYLAMMTGIELPSSGSVSTKSETTEEEV